VALLVLQLSVEALPEATVVGCALSEITGGRLATVTVAVCVAEPPAPIQVKSKSVVAVSEGEPCEPLVPNVPDQPPAAVQKLALVEFHVKVVELPIPIEDGAAVSVTVGGGAVTSTVIDRLEEPPGPLQFRL
jgi:hypothetical protein